MARAAKHRDNLVRTSMRLFRRQGYASTGLQQILAESGAPKGSLYHYFPRRQGGDRRSRGRARRIDDSRDARAARRTAPYLTRLRQRVGGDDGGLDGGIGISLGLSAGDDSPRNGPTVTGHHSRGPGRDRRLGRGGRGGAGARWGEPTRSEEPRPTAGRRHGGGARSSPRSAIPRADPRPTQIASMTAKHYGAANPRR